jgi:hypothetical protein
MSNYDLGLLITMALATGAGIVFIGDIVAKIILIAIGICGMFSIISTLVLLAVAKLVARVRDGKSNRTNIKRSVC